MTNRLFTPRNPLSGQRIPGAKNSRMKLPGFSIAVIIFLFSILIVLAVLQYCWSGQLSKAEYERMQSSLLASMDQFRLHFNTELRETSMLLQPETAILMHNDLETYAENCITLLEMPELQQVRNIYLWTSENMDDFQLLELNKFKKTFEPISWPSEMAEIRKRHEYIFNNTGPQPQPRPRFITITSNQSIFLSRPLDFPEPPFTPRAANKQFKGILIIELNPEIVLGEQLSRLTQSYFGSRADLIYHVAVVDRNNPQNILFKSDPSLTSDDFTQPDARLGLIDTPPEPPDSNGPYPSMEREGRAEPNPEPPFIPGRFRPGPQARMNNDGPGQPADTHGPSWDILAKHGKGSLEQVVTANRYRNLSISFGSLLLLAASMVLIIISSRRAHRLTQLQMDFVAGVSHELRTPLAVICSAGDNLADGVVAESDEAIHRYGKLIRSEGRKLTAMVEQIMQFAGLKSGRHRYRLQLAQINAVVETALQQVQPMLENAGFTVETTLTPDLLPVNIDPSAMIHIIQNLVQNAIKYSGETHRLCIQTACIRTNQGMCIELAIEDKGIGIGKKDLPHIFDPFYRGSTAVEKQIRGTGLGLYIVREAITSMGGDIRVESTIGKGSIFTIHLPAATEDSNPSASSNNEGHTDHAI